MGRNALVASLVSSFVLFGLSACGGGGASKQPVAAPQPDAKPAAKPKPPAPPPEPQPEPVDVAALEPWPGHVEDGKVIVAAADVDGEVLRRVLVPEAIEIINVRKEGVVTGRVAGSRVGALAALVAVQPELKLGPRARLAGKGPALALDLVGADSGELFGWLGDALATNVVVMAPPMKLTVSARAPSAQKLLDEVVKAAGLVTEKPAANVVVVRAKSQPKIGKLPAKGKKLELDVRGARPGDVLALVGAVTGAAAPTGTCTAGEPITLRVRAVPAAAAAKLVERVGGGKVTACALEQTEDAPKGATLVGFATDGARAFAVVMDGERAILVGGDPPAWDPEDEADAAAPSLEGARLAATITGIASGNVAIVETRRGFHVLRPVDEGVGVTRIDVGEIEIRDAAGATRTLPLAKRP